MPAEWQARQLLLTASAPGPGGNVLSPSGKSTVVDLSSNAETARPAGDARIAANEIPTTNILRTIALASGNYVHIDGLDDIAHESRGIPVGYIRLSLSIGVGAADQHSVWTGRRQTDLDRTRADTALA